MRYNVVHMKAISQPGRIHRKETGLRVPEDQLRNFDFLAGLTRGRKKRSHLMLEAFDEYIAVRMSRLTPAGHN